MRAAIVTRLGAPDVIEVSETPDPIPGPGEVSIDVTHAAVGLVDVFIRQGLYKDREGLPQPPYVPGLEVAGTVRELGDGVDGLTVGEQVVTLSGTGAEGGYAAIRAVDARFAVVNSRECLALSRGRPCSCHLSARSRNVGARLARSPGARKQVSAVGSLRWAFSIGTARHTRRQGDRRTRRLRYSVRLGVVSSLCERAAGAATRRSSWSIKAPHRSGSSRNGA
jgi:NADPH:quinone reductase-like Zn-dependent oxidoreductase